LCRFLYHYWAVGETGLTFAIAALPLLQASAGHVDGVGQPAASSDIERRLYDACHNVPRCGFRLYVGTLLNVGHYLADAGDLQSYSTYLSDPAGHSTARVVALLLYSHCLKHKSYWIQVKHYQKAAFSCSLWSTATEPDAFFSWRDLFACIVIPMPFCSISGLSASEQSSAARLSVSLSVFRKTASFSVIIVCWNGAFSAMAWRVLWRQRHGGTTGLWAGGSAACMSSFYKPGKQGMFLPTAQNRLLSLFYSPYPSLLCMSPCGCCQDDFAVHVAFLLTCVPRHTVGIIAMTFMLSISPSPSFFQAHSCRAVPAGLAARKSRQHLLQIRLQNARFRRKNGWLNMSGAWTVNLDGVMLMNWRKWKKSMVGDNEKTNEHRGRA